MKSIAIILAFFCLSALATDTELTQMQIYTQSVNLTAVWEYGWLDYEYENEDTCCYPQYVFVNGTGYNYTLQFNFTSSMLNSSYCKNLSITGNYSVTQTFNYTADAENQQVYWIPQNTSTSVTSPLAYQFQIAYWQYLTIYNIKNNQTLCYVSYENETTYYEEEYGNSSPSIISSNNSSTNTSGSGSGLTPVSNVVANLNGTWNFEPGTTYGNSNINQCCYPQSVTVNGSNTTYTLQFNFSASVLNSTYCKAMGIASNYSLTEAFQNATTDGQTTYLTFATAVNYTSTGMAYTFSVSSWTELQLYNFQGGQFVCSAMYYNYSSYNYDYESNAGEFDFEFNNGTAPDLGVPDFTGLWTVDTNISDFMSNLGSCCYPQSASVIGLGLNLYVSFYFSPSMLSSSACQSLNITTNFSQPAYLMGQNQGGSYAYFPLSEVNAVHSNTSTFVYMFTEISNAPEMMFMNMAKGNTTCAALLKKTAPRNLTGTWNLTNSTTSMGSCCYPQSVTVTGSELNLTLSFSFSSSVLANSSCKAMNISGNYMAGGTFVSLTNGSTTLLALPNETSYTPFNSYAQFAFVLSSQVPPALNFFNVINGSESCLAAYNAPAIDLADSEFPPAPSPYEFTGKWSINNSNTSYSHNLSTCCYPQSIAVNGTGLHMTLQFQFNSTALASNSCKFYNITNSYYTTANYIELDAESEQVFVPQNIFQNATSTGFDYGFAVLPSNKAALIFANVISGQETCLAQYYQSSVGLESTKIIFSLLSMIFILINMLL